MKQCLALPWTTRKIAPLAVLFDLRNVPTHSAPSLYLIFIMGTPSA